MSRVTIKDIQVNDNTITVDLELPSGKVTSYKTKNTEDARKERVIDGYEAPRFVHRARAHAKQKHKEREQPSISEKTGKRGYDEYVGESKNVDIRESGKANRGKRRD